MKDREVHILACWYGGTAPTPVYDSRYLIYLHKRFRALHDYARYDLTFSVLTDAPNAVPRPWRPILFKTAFPSKLKKLEMFRDDLGFDVDDRIVFTDLDNLLLRPLTPLLDYRGEFGIRREFRNCTGASPVQSSWVMWRAGAGHHLFEKACKDPHLARNYPIGGGNGDQLFIGLNQPRWDDLAELYPGQLVSWKWQYKHDPQIRKTARVAYCHGKRTEKPHVRNWQP